jgi:signal transduction histidine kinase/CheY-like chemotaxis protein
MISAPPSPAQAHNHSAPSSAPGDFRSPILILAPLGNDARLASQFLRDAGLPSQICNSVRDLCSRQAGADCGALLLAEEVIDSINSHTFTQWLAGQPSWSDIPIAIVVAGGGDSAIPRRRFLSAFGKSGNITLLERPFCPGTLVSTMEVALRSRQRQFQVRDLLDQNARDSLALAAQAQALLEASRRKDEFLAMLAHELRNPLASIGSAVGVLMETPEPDTTSWAVDVIDRQGRQLSRLVDDLLDVSRITRGKIELHRELIDAATCLENACETARPWIIERGHTLLPSIPRGALWLQADPTRLEQIIVNLLGNAAKYTERGGCIWINARREANSILIDIRDTGIGIPADKITGMFELFVQGERSPARSEGGLGIGLTVVQALCQLHGGTVSAQSHGAGHGTTFTVRLPAAKTTPATTRASAPSDTQSKPSISANGAGARILIVDDNIDTAHGLARLLTRRDYHVRLAHDGPTAIQLAHDFAPTAVLLDIGLPGMDGYEVAHRLRSEPTCSDTAIIAISGYGQEADRRRSTQAGFDHHLVKPVSLDKVLTLLASNQSK